MHRTTGRYRNTGTAEEAVKCFIPHSLPPQNPELTLTDEHLTQLQKATDALTRLSVCENMVPSAQWFLYGFVRKEALVSSRIEGTQATFHDIAIYEATQRTEQPADVEEVCNYITALTYARKQLHDPKGLPISRRLLTETHKLLMSGVRGADRQPGVVRKSQNWIGGSRPGNALFVPPPADCLDELLADLEGWIHTSDETLPPLIRAGLAHVQFETIHPFLDGNGRLGRMLITLLAEHWGFMQSPLLYLSLAFKRRQSEYYRYLGAVRTEGDWEGWISFFLDCVIEAAEDGIITATRLFKMISDDRRSFLAHKTASVSAIRLLEILPEHPMITTTQVVTLFETSKPTARKAINALVEAGILEENTGKARDRVYVYRSYLNELARDTDI